MILLLQLDRDEDDRIVKQFQFNYWSDHNAPNPSAVMEYRRRIHAFHKTRSGPIIVHCRQDTHFPQILPIYLE